MIYHPFLLRLMCVVCVLCFCFVLFFVVGLIVAAPVTPRRTLTGHSTRQTIKREEKVKRGTHRYEPILGIHTLAVALVCSIECHHCESIDR